jgi:hypothetical protein
VSENSERWQDYPYLVEWVAELKTWAAKYEIYEFIPSDENQEDPTGRIPSVVNAEELGTISKEFIWTLKSVNGGEVYIESEFLEWFEDDAWIRGWYVGRVSHEDKDISIEAGKDLCWLCQGTSEFENPEGEMEYCSHDDGIWIDIMDTDFKV